MKDKETTQCEICKVYHCDDVCMDCLPVVIDEVLKPLQVPRALIDNSNSSHYDFWNAPNYISGYFDLNYHGKKQ